MSEQTDASRRPVGVDPVLRMIIQVIVSVALWTAVGAVVDLLLSTGPWGAFTGALVGTVVALVLVRRQSTAAAEPATTAEPATSGSAPTDEDDR